MVATKPVALDRVIRVPEQAMATFANEEWIGLDLETSGLSPWKDKIAVVTLYGERSGETAVLHIRGRMPDHLRQWLSDPRRNFIVHNGGGFDMLFLANSGVDVYEPTWHDTLIGEGAALSTNRRNVSRSLQASLQRRLKVEIKKDQRTSMWMAPELDEEQVIYCADDVRHLPGLMREQWKKVEGTTQQRAMETEMRLLPVVVRMTMNGLPIDIPALKRYIADGEGVMSAMRESLEARFNWTGINLNSPIQLKKALASVGMELPSTAFEILKTIELNGDPPGSDIAAEILSWRFAAQRKKMYTDEWIRKYVTDYWVHARFWQVGTDTGRFSSSEPNLQQVPKDMRFIFGNLPGHMIVSVDYSQIEVRVAARIANDKAMLQALEEEDIHTAIAAQVFNTPVHMVTKDQRKLSKAMSFTLLFGGGAGTLYNYSRMSGGTLTKPQCYDLVGRFFARFQGIEQTKFKAQQRADWRSPVTITLPTGLRRVLVDKQLTATRILNTLVQGTAAAGLKYGILECADRGLVPYLGATVHDELVSCVPEREAEDYAHEMEEAMVAGMLKAIPGTPVKAEPSIGPTWK